jgi:hypothetical protein
MAGSDAERRLCGGLRGPPGEAGFLLVEVLVAMVLLAVGVSGALVLVGQASRAMHRAGALSGSAPLAVLLGEAGPEGLGLPESMAGDAWDGVGDAGGPLTWWWEDAGLELRLGPAGDTGGRNGRRIRVAWLDPLPLWEPRIQGVGPGAAPEGDPGAEPGSDPEGGGVGVGG